jgi:hypothetical protein
LLYCVLVGVLWVVCLTRQYVSSMVHGVFRAVKHEGTEASSVCVVVLWLPVSHKSRERWFGFC